MQKFLVGETTQKILSDLKTDVWFSKSTTSTNAVARNEVSEVKSDLKVYLSDHQSAGRGRRQNTWTDTGQGEALLSSWSFSFSKNPQPILAPLVGLAIYQNLKKHFRHLNFSIKAPNDILLSEEKLCGILIENVLSQTQGRSVIGIGLNVFDSPKNLNATHLSAHHEVNRTTWQDFITDLKFDLFSALKNSQHENLSHEACSQLLQALKNNRQLSGELLEVTPKGSLIFKNQQIDWHSL